MLQRKAVRLALQRLLPYQTFGTSIALPPLFLEAEEAKISKFVLKEQAIGLRSGYGTSLHYFNRRYSQSPGAPNRGRERLFSTKNGPTMIQSASKIFRLKKNLETTAAGRPERVAQAVKQRDQALEQISNISDSATLMSFFEDYKARLSRISDRENSIFMRALLDRLNAQSVLNLEP